MSIAASMQMPNVFDTKSMTELQARARKDPDGSLRMVAKQFEAYFIGLMLKQARESMMGSMMDSNQTKMFAGLADQQMSLSVANSGGFGFADMLVKQLEQRQGRFGSEKAEKTAAAAEETDALKEDNKTPLRDDRQKLAQRTMRLNQQMPSMPFLPDASARQKNDPVSDIEDTDGLSASMNIIVRFREAQNMQKTAYSRAQAAQYYAQQATRIDPAYQADISADNGIKDHADQFVDMLRPHAEEAAKVTGIPARFLIGHAALETGWGRRKIMDDAGNNSHNLFGIKAGRSWSGAVANAMTTEYVNGKPQKQVEPFRAYGSYRDAFIDYANLLKSSSRYQQVLNQNDPAKFAQSLQDAGYATDPKYAQKLESVILARKLNGIK